MAKPFVDGVSTSREGAALAKTIIDLGNSLGLEIVAEGIEGTAELAQLRRLGCHLGQGYLFSPPLPSEEVETALADGAWATHDDDGLPAAA
jgi:EAL domain-containing protein (putative c-di-GMP-specific phosphodiesterase class I)